MNPALKLAPLAALTALLAACPQSQANPAATASLVNQGGAAVGTATFTQTGAGTEVVVSLRNSGVSAGEHGIHVHQVGSCTEGPDMGVIVPFGGAGPHFDPKTTNKHGARENTENQAHAGDLGNITVDASGNGELRLTTAKLAVAPGDLSVAGRAVIVHANRDDLATNPGGNSGARLVCGAIAAR